MLFAVALPLATTAARSESPAHPDNHHGWEELSLLNAIPAQAAFAEALAADPTRREARLGAALALLQLRSRTAGTIANAIRQLEALRQENPNDDPGIGAAYYLARIAQVHSFEPDPAAAVAGYRALLADHPGHHYAQLAAPKLALLLLYDAVPPNEWDRRAREIEALLPRLTAPEAARDTRLILAVAYIRMRNDPVRAYPLLAACLDAGSITRAPRLNAVLVLAAETAGRIGQPAAAAGYYTRFLTEFPQDAKADEIRRRVRQLQAEAAP